MQRSEEEIRELRRIYHGPGGWKAYAEACKAKGISDTERLVLFEEHILPAGDVVVGSLVKAMSTGGDPCIPANN